MVCASIMSPLSLSLPDMKALTPLSLPVIRRRKSGAASVRATRGTQSCVNSHDQDAENPVREPSTDQGIDVVQAMAHQRDTDRA